MQFTTLIEQLSEQLSEIAKAADTCPDGKKRQSLYDEYARLKQVILNMPAVGITDHLIKLGIVQENVKIIIMLANARTIKNTPVSIGDFENILSVMTESRNLFDELNQEKRQIS